MKKIFNTLKTKLGNTISNIYNWLVQPSVLGTVILIAIAENILMVLYYILMCLGLL